MRNVNLPALARNRMGEFGFLHETLVQCLGHPFFWRRAKTDSPFFCQDKERELNKAGNFPKRGTCNIVPFWEKVIKVNRVIFFEGISDFAFGFKDLVKSGSKDG